MQFSTQAAKPNTGNGRYTLSKESAPTAEGGTVAIGVDRKESAHLVHTVGRATEAIALHAVATAVATGKVIPFSDLVAAVKEAGNLDKLAQAVTKAQG